MCYYLSATDSFKRDFTLEKKSNLVIYSLTLKMNRHELNFVFTFVVKINSLDVELDCIKNFLNN